MNQYHYSYESSFSHPRKRNAAYYRSRARQALSRCYWWALLAAFLASLLGGLTTSGGISLDTNFSSSGGKVNIGVGDQELVQSITSAMQTGDFTDIMRRISPFFLVFLIGCATAFVVSILFSVFISSPIKVGYQRYNLNVIDGNGTRIAPMFGYFKRAYGKSIGLNLLHGILLTLPILPALAMFLVWFLPWMWNGLSTLENMRSLSLLFVEAFSRILLLSALSLIGSIVQLVLQYRYAFAFMILAEYPRMGVIAALRSSASLMRGKKWKLFCLRFSFIGWILLACCTCGIGFIFLTPYMQAAEAAFYDDIANRAAARETDFPSLDPNDYMV